MTVAANPARPNPWPTLGKLVVSLIAAGVLSAGLVLPFIGGLGLVAGHEADKFRNTVCDLQETKPPQRTTLLARDGKTVLATLFKQDRQDITLNDVPTYLQEALVATEDRRFYSHHGVDMRGLLRAALSNSGGGDTQGGSTLTMQYVKQARYYAAGDDVKKQNAAIAQNLNRKIEDAKCALYIENTKHESKQQILTNYLNIAFFGEHAYGIQTAAQTYFHKDAKDLTLGESAMLVGLLRAPSTYDPFVDRAAATTRRNEVIQNLVAVGKLSQSQADAEERKPIQLASDAPPQVQQGCANSSSKVPNIAFFCEYAVDWLENVDKIPDAQLTTGGLRIVTTLDPTIQASAQKRLFKTIPAKSPMTAVLPVIDPRTGDVLAMASSKTYGLSTPTQTEQPVFTKPVSGAFSTYKLFPLLSALSIGIGNNWQLESSDSTGTYKAQKCLTSSTTINGDANETYSRNETLESGTRKSSNTFFVALADRLFQCHLGPMVSLAQKLGISSLNQASDAVQGQTFAKEIVANQRAQAFVLGTVPTSPLEMAGAYGAIANGGKFNAPAPILSVTDSSRNALPVNRPQETQVVAPEVAARALEILKGDTDSSEGTASNQFTSWYADGGSDIAGKTGTGESNKKNKNGGVWFIGVTPKLVAASALINFDTPGTPSQGLPGMKTGEAYGDYAAKVWLAALKPSLQHEGSWTLPDPNTIGSLQVPDITGQSVSDARHTLDGYGLKLQLLDPNTYCPSVEASPYGDVGPFGPLRANPGDTVTVCLSLGIKPQVYAPPPPPPVHHPSPSPSTSRSSSSSSPPSGGHTSPGGGGGGGGGGGSSSHHPGHCAPPSRDQHPLRTVRTGCGGCRSLAGQASWRRTSSLTRRPSARPATRGETSFMTAPMPCGPLAPLSAIAARTSSASSSSPSWAGR